MRLYAAKIIRGSMVGVAEGTQETRDAILWDVLPASRYCRVKIQGSNQLIVARYPQNWRAAPGWLKPGVAVRVIHVGGLRGRIEVFGLGRAVPTPVAGNTLPDISPGADGVVTGCYVREHSPANMSVIVGTGSFRISGTIYYIIAEHDEAIDASPAAGQFRYDLISVGADSVIDYTKGTASATPARPAIGSSHVALAYVLVYGGATTIKNTDISHEWTAPTPNRMVITISDEDILWADPDKVNVDVEIFDQYGNPYAATNYFKLEMYQGNGVLHSDYSGDSAAMVEKTTTDTHYTFTYTRNKIDTGESDESFPPDISPVLKASAVSGEFSTSNFGFIRLYDSSGNIMM